MAIFLDYAERLGLKDKDGAPLVKWRTPEECFEAFKECSRGRPNDHTGMSYAKLRERGPIQWPCTEEAPDGTERLYTDHVFKTDPNICEDYGHDLVTGAAYTEAEYKALSPGGRAILRAAPYVPSPEEPSGEYPLRFTTGRTVHHFHTRTKTGRAPELQQAAPDVWVELARADAERYGVAEGDLVRVVSVRGELEARVRVTGAPEGVVFAPFHYGYWDEGGAEPDGRRPRAANELTLTAWDPVSKQPLFKNAAVRLEPLG
jgi:anaerobic selenocysteine-containing dehydrogenase